MCRSTDVNCTDSSQYGVACSSMLEAAAVFGCVWWFVCQILWGFSRWCARAAPLQLVSLLEDSSSADYNSSSSVGRQQQDGSSVSSSRKVMFAVLVRGYDARSAALD